MSVRTPLSPTKPAFLDPPKAGAREALTELANLGVAVKVVTGDNEQVTRHVCGQLGLKITGMLSGPEVADLTDEALAAKVDNTTLFCRVTPPQKSRIIASLRRKGHVVGYLGDGINDAPPLHVADVGFSVDTAVGRGQGGCRHHSAAERTRRASRRRAGGAPHFCEYTQVYDDGNEFEFWQHVLNGRRRSVLAFPSYAADPNSSQQLALRSFGNGDSPR